MDLDLTKLTALLYRRVWRARLDSLSAWRARLLWLVRLLLVLLRDVVDGQLTLRAMSLVYTTLLSIVPLLALSFSVLKAFGVHNQLEPMLRRFLAPLGDNGQELTQRTLQFIENMNVGVLGSVGLALLLYTAVSLVHKIEESFNFIWHVSQPRSLGQRFSSYLSVLLVGPILVFAAIGITAAVSHLSVVQWLLGIEPIGRIAFEFGRLLPYLLVIGAFTFIYAFIPNTNVRAGPALVGGIVGGVLWQTAGWAFATFVTHFNSYQAIYSGFALVILFMIWLYLSWLILLLGASVSFYYQHPEYLVSEAGEPRLSNRMRERLALLIMSLIARHHREGRAPWTRDQLTQSLDVPMHAVEIVLDALCKSGLLAESNNTPCTYLPARDLSRVSVKQLLDAVRAAGEDRFLSPERLPAPAAVEDVLERLERASRNAVGEISVAQLADADAPAMGRESAERVARAGRL